MAGTENQGQDKQNLTLIESYQAGFDLGVKSGAISGAMQAFGDASDMVLVVASEAAALVDDPVEALKVSRRVAKLALDLSEKALNAGKRKP